MSLQTRISALITAIKGDFDELDARVTTLESGFEIGQVGFFWDVPSTGWIKANAPLLSRAVYSGLFSKYGTFFGEGDGSTTFVGGPDLRGEFIRGFDDGRGVDVGRVLGSAQLDALQGHKHVIRAYNNVAIAYFAGDYNGGAGTAGAGTTRSRARVGEAATDANYGTARIAAESRSRNVALLACIKY